jgi:hypothetical protein
VMARPGVLEIFGQFFDGRMRARAHPAARDNHPRSEADQQAAQYARDAFQVIHTNALSITRRELSGRRAFNRLRFERAEQALSFR